MRFNSIEFLVFFPVVSILFYIIPFKYRWMLLLGASYWFYLSWKPKYVIVPLAVTAISYFAGLWMDSDKNPARRRLVLTFSLLASLAILFFFKTINFSDPAYQNIFNQLGIGRFLSEYIVLPLGISFFTFQTMSYTIDVYRGIIKPEKHLGIYGLFVVFFPQLPAGPIGRANLLLPQYYQEHRPDFQRITAGLQRMAWGFFKKLVIADRLALLVDSIYGNPSSYQGIPLILATYAFAFQIYCDFSGYADIALGAAQVLGFKLTENFQYPYIAQSIPDFWRRWHISLYNWLRDYIFYPLRRLLIQRKFSSTNLVAISVPTMVTMVASGLWHGSNWTFLIWGALHGLFLVLSVLWARAKKPSFGSLVLPSWFSASLKIFWTFHLVCFAWIFFRANSLPDAIYIVTHLFGSWESPVTLFNLMPGGGYEFLIALIALILMGLVQWFQRNKDHLGALDLRKPVWLRWFAYYGLVVIILMFGIFESTEFIYAQF